MEIRRLCVFCSSSSRLPEPFREEARSLGARMASEGIDLVYGGGSVGLMGVLADAVLAGGGKVTGVIPDFLSTKEIAHEGLTRMVVTRSMHERKQEMSRLADALGILPGGFRHAGRILRDPDVEAARAARPPGGRGEQRRWFDPLMEYCRRAAALGSVAKSSLDLFTVVERADEVVTPCCGCGARFRREAARPDLKDPLTRAGERRRPSGERRSPSPAVLPQQKHDQRRGEHDQQPRLPQVDDLRLPRRLVPPHLHRQAAQDVGAAQQPLDLRQHALGDPLPPSPRGPPSPRPAAAPGRLPPSPASPASSATAATPSTASRRAARGSGSGRASRYSCAALRWRRAASRSNRLTARSASAASLNPSHPGTAGTCPGTGGRRRLPAPAARSGRGESASGPLP